MRERVPVVFAVIEECGWGVHNMTHDIHDDWTLQHFYFTGAWLSFLLTFMVLQCHAWNLSVACQCIILTSTIKIKRMVKESHLYLLIPPTLQSHLTHHMEERNTYIELLWLEATGFLGGWVTEVGHTIFQTSRGQVGSNLLHSVCMPKEASKFW